MDKTVREIIKRLQVFFWFKDVSALKLILMFGSFLWALVFALPMSELPQIMTELIPKLGWSFLFLIHGFLVLWSLSENTKVFTSANFLNAILGCILWSMVACAMIVCPLTNFLSLVPTVALAVGSWWILVRAEPITKRK